MIKLIEVFFIILTMISCSKQNEPTPTLINEKSIATDFKIPKAFLDKLKESMGKDIHAQPEIIFTNLDVVLYTDQENVLKLPMTRIKLPSGGGQIDLAEHVVGQGSFYLSFPNDQFNVNQMSLENIFYISDSPQVKIDNESYGLGCGKWIELKSKLKELQIYKFLKLNTFNQHYVHVAAGQYIVVLKKGLSQFFLAHLNLTDSRYTHKLCSNIFAHIK
jgi:hypothetical protein